MSCLGYNNGYGCQGINAPACCLPSVLNNYYGSYNTNCDTDDNNNPVPEPARSICWKTNTLYRMFCGVSQTDINTELAKCNTGNCAPTGQNGYPFDSTDYNFSLNNATQSLANFLSAAPCISSVTSTNSTFTNPYYNYCLNTADLWVTPLPASPSGSPINSNYPDGDQWNTFYTLIPIPNTQQSYAVGYLPTTQYTGGGTTCYLDWEDPVSGTVNNSNFSEQLSALNALMNSPQEYPPNSGNTCCIGISGNCTGSTGYVTLPTTINGNIFTSQFADIYPTPGQVSQCLEQSCVGTAGYICDTSGSTNNKGTCKPVTCGATYTDHESCLQDCGCYACTGGICSNFTPGINQYCPYSTQTACVNSGNGCVAQRKSYWWVVALIGGLIIIILVIVLSVTLTRKKNR